MDSDNPPYLTMTEMNGKYCVTLMEWQHTEEEYKAVKCIPYTSQTLAVRVMREWADNDGLEIR